MARRLATVGYFVMLPNLYYRAGRDTKYGPHVLVSASPRQCADACGPKEDDDPSPSWRTSGFMLDYAARPRGSGERSGGAPTATA